MGDWPVHDAALRYFLEVVRSGSIAEASVRLNVAASAISRQISKLEQELGSPLFERRSRRMVPSAAGELLAQHARRTLLGEEQVLAEVRRLRGLERGLVRVGCTEGFATDFMPRAISSFRRNYPGITFEMHVDAPREVTRMVRDGDADIGLSFRFDPDRSVHVEHASSTPLVAIMAPGHPLADRPFVTLADISAYPIGLAAKETTARQIFDMACGAEGIVIDPVMSTNYMAGLWCFAEASGGIIVTGRITALVRSWRFQVMAVPVRTVTSNERRYEVQTMLGRTLPDAIRAFVTHITTQLDQIDSGGSQPLDFRIASERAAQVAEI